jgi:hypothetical protein
MQLWESAHINLTSLLNQNTDKEYKVLLNVPYHYKNNNNEEYVLSDELIKFAESNPKLIINRVEEDFGPIVKVTGILEISKDPEDIIIVCDDDQEYHPDMLEYILKKMEQYPKDALCFRGDNPIEKREWIEDGVEKYILKSTHLTFPVKVDLQLLIPGHWHSVGYKRKFFGDDFLSKEFLEYSNNDDVLVGYYLRKNQIHLKCVAWDKETDFRPVNHHGRPAYSFPIVQALPFPNSGFWEFRQQSGNGSGTTVDHVLNFLHDEHIIFIAKNE